MSVILADALRAKGNTQRRSVTGQLRVHSKETVAANVVRADLLDPPDGVHRAGCPQVVQGTVDGFASVG